MILSFNDLDFVVHEDEFSQNHARFLEQEVKYSREYFWLERDKEKLLNDLWDKAAHFNLNRDEVDFNGLHNQFAISVNTANHEDKLIWDDINNLIHQIELLETGAPPRWGYTDGDKTYRIPTEAFPKFTVQRKLGTLYIAYAHVGKHFAEIVNTKDWNIKSSQVQPQVWARATFFMHMGDPITKDMENDWLKRVAQPAWHRMADKMPHQFHDPRLAIGYIPFADIVGDINKEELISHISKYAK